ncbi:hypothetical protein M1M07_24210 [Rhodococcus sp. HM1]|uniref:hypothetical protein n=1 Tax=unclassified Rhodococcus (in: high G+C Gram-positive bacteria) TaxID=192944 RepID=UPI0018CC9FB7|nr:MULTISPECIES: hypothetical protein [unclassified Rhodococcus (in: high G+C Gram-positive bacteria)]MBH0120368.1 hypothetical protein [Rhodococcus sp. CX]MCK8674202.1 hypothetical protein [Rhodococcus sp. HM1]
MLQPNGPLPPEIYWRRRALAVGVGLVVLALVVWLVMALTGGGDDPEPENTAAEVTSTTATTTTSADATAEPAAAGSGGGSSTGTSAGTSASATTTSSTTATPVAAGQCPDQSLAVRVTADQPNYRVGDEPAFTIVITNIGTEQCERDLGAGLQQVLVYSLDGATRFWSNTDCFPESTADVRTLAPGDQAAFSVKWSGTTSAPGCQQPREPVGPGAYSVVGQLGGLRSTPEPFNVA